MKKKTIIAVIIFFVISLLAERFVFNYKHWVSLRGNEIALDNLVMGSSYEDNGDGTYTVTSGSDTSIYITGFKEELLSSYIRIVKANREESEKGVISVWQYVTDESSQYEYGLPEREIWADEVRSSYMNYHLYGKCTGIRILPNISTGSVVTVDIRLNPEVPIFFSWARVVALFAFMNLLYLFRPGSGIYKIRFAELAPGKRRVVLLGLWGVHIVLFYFLVDLNPAFTWGIPEHHKQYQKLAEAFKEGSSALLETPAASLQALENPYDSAYRDETVAAQGESYAWDTAYYQGKYYVYFGVVPALLFYFPYYLLTGTHIANYIVVFIVSVLFMFGLLGVLQESAKKWFMGLSFGMWLLTAELTILGSGILYLVKRPDFYNIPVLTGLAFGLLGLACFFKAQRENEISLNWLGFGVLLTALVAGCRPQLMLFAAIPVILFRKQLFSKAFYGSSTGKKAVVAVLLPLVVVGGLLMYYNYSRFGSVLDFGANYNLTTNDMRFRGWVWGRIPLGMFVYFLQPMRFTAEFPFAQTLYTGSQYMGLTIQEHTVGGIFTTHIFALFGVLPFLIRSHVKKQWSAPWLIAVCSMLAAVVIAVADTEMAGILWRYQNDFSVFIMIAAVLTCWMISCHDKIAGSSLQKYVVCAVLLCMVTELFFQGSTFFLDVSDSLKQMRPDLYAHAKYLIGFWL